MPSLVPRPGDEASLMSDPTGKDRGSGDVRPIPGASLILTLIGFCGAMNFLIKPAESAKCHQTLSSQVGSGCETTLNMLCVSLYWLCKV